MSHINVKVEIEEGRIIPLEPEKIPRRGNGILTVLSDSSEIGTGTVFIRHRVALPLIKGDGQRLVNPTSAELDASFWGDKTA